MWPLNHELNDWFDHVNAEREKKYGGSGGSDGDEEVPMMSNELASARG